MSGPAEFLVSSPDLDLLIENLRRTAVLNKALADLLNEAANAIASLITRNKRQAKLVNTLHVEHERNLAALERTIRDRDREIKRILAKLGEEGEDSPYHRPTGEPPDHD